MIKRLRADLLYALSGVAFLILSLFSEGSTNIALHDTHILITNFHLFLGLGFLFISYFLVALGFNHFGKPFNKSIALTHWFITLAGIILISVLLQKYVNETPIRHSDFSVYYPDETFKESHDYSWLVTYLFFIILFAQLIFVINVIFSFVPTKKDN